MTLLDKPGEGSELALKDEREESDEGTSNVTVFLRSYEIFDGGTPKGIELDFSNIAKRLLILEVDSVSIVVEF